jgi:hypothetical protein
MNWRRWLPDRRLSAPVVVLTGPDWHGLAGRPLNRAFACPGCGEEERIAPHAVRRGADGRSYDLWICLTCTAVINSTDLCGAGERVVADQAGSSAEFYALSDEVIASLPEEVGKNGSLVAFLLDHCPGLGRDAFLDFGAGRGCLASAATEVFGQAFALELDLTMLRQVHPHLPNRDRITLASGPDRLPPVDAIAAFHVLEHLPDVKMVLDPFVSLLKPGGALFFQVPLLRNDYLVYTHYTFFGEPAARAACQRLGLEVTGVWYDDANDFLTCIARRPLTSGA